MKAAVVKSAGQPPVYEDFEAPPVLNGVDRITVKAAALSQITRARAAGTHYSAGAQFPLVPGIDGVGVSEHGRRVYFMLPQSPWGGMGETTLANPAHCVELPAAIDDVTAAAMANPAMSSWAALLMRAKFSQGENVLINGATGTSGRLAVQVAKYLGARRVIATGRNPDALQSLRALGADAVVSLNQDEAARDAELKRHFANGIDVVLDYLWGPSANAIIAAAVAAAPQGATIRFVQIGTIGGATIALAGTALRSSSLMLMGSGIGSLSMPQLMEAVSGVLTAAVAGRFTMETLTAPLEDVAAHWSKADSAARTVFSVG